MRKIQQRAAKRAAASVATGVMFYLMISNPRSLRTLPVTHAVMIQFNENATAWAIEDACNWMFSLQDSCRHPYSGRPYVSSIACGKDSSPERPEDGPTYVVVAEFETDGEKDYFIHKDPAHLEALREIEPLIEKATVLDYSSGLI
ncbi:hypothetical protein B0T25DRAFT_365595 [Lasiosphaeria hispida]|uniref:Stress-response A/B barrel domain-containing protein n=1 Tax=Lasiosphaeria hispida TaxID=260671 RepID=A0AAJ0M7X4_9PEZI|nr:hypothetical protein B0T25DRAFT_365595 [Lasiosphaeria hispida]